MPPRAAQGAAASAVYVFKRFVEVINVLSLFRLTLQVIEFSFATNFESATLESPPTGRSAKPSRPMRSILKILRRIPKRRFTNGCLRTASLGLEPRTSRFTAIALPTENKKTSPRPLGHGPCLNSPTWTRTKDLAVNSRSLYQLSYRGSETHKRTGAIGCVKGHT